METEIMILWELTKVVTVEMENSKEHDWLLDVEILWFFVMKQSYLQYILVRILPRA